MYGDGLEPTGVAVDEHGAVYVANDQGTNRFASPCLGESVAKTRRGLMRDAAGV